MIHNEMIAQSAHTSYTYDFVEALDRGEVLEVVRVRDLARSPLTLVGRVVNHGRIPLAPVLGVGLQGATDKLSQHARSTEVNAMYTYRFHSPQPGASSHLGLRTVGAIHSPSSSSSHSSGFSESAEKDEAVLMPQVFHATYQGQGLSPVRRRASPQASQPPRRGPRTAPPHPSPQA